LGQQPSLLGLFFFGCGFSWMSGYIQQTADWRKGGKIMANQNAKW
jgi:hypothetical protein